MAAPCGVQPSPCKLRRFTPDYLSPPARLADAAQCAGMSLGCMITCARKVQAHHISSHLWDTALIMPAVAALYTSMHLTCLCLTQLPLYAGTFSGCMATCGWLRMA